MVTFALTPAQRSNATDALGSLPMERAVGDGLKCSDQILVELGTHIEKKPVRDRS
jgi:hypothetical protein